MDDILLKAVLSLDVYNRGYCAGINLDSWPGVHIANVTVSQTSTSVLQGQDINVGFYAVAYKISETEKVIARIKGVRLI